jgi:ABC-type polar amino acid transport system ATPase subunit
MVLLARRMEQQLALASAGGPAVRAWLGHSLLPFQLLGLARHLHRAPAADLLVSLMFAPGETLEAPEASAARQATANARVALAALLFTGPEILLLDEPSNHLDLESITALNNGMLDFRGTMLFTSRDHELTQTVANRIIELTPKGIIDKLMTYDEYISSEAIKEQRKAMYQ